MIERMDKFDMPIAAGAVTFPAWAQWLPWGLQVALALLGGVYMGMRIYRERLRIKALRRGDPSDASEEN